MGRDEGLERVIGQFEVSCAEFARLVANADEASDAMDFTGKLHELSLLAGRVQGLGDGLAALTGDEVWRRRADATLRAYLGSSMSQESGGQGGRGAEELEDLEG